MLRLRPPQNYVSSRRDHNDVVSTTREQHNNTPKILTQKGKSSTQLQLKSPRIGVRQQQVIEAHHVVTNNNTSIGKSSIHRSRQSERRKEDESTQQNDKHRQRRRISQNIESSNHILMQNNNSSESSSHDNHQRRRRRKGVSSSYNNNNTQSLFIALIRLVIVSTLAYFIVVNAVSIIYNVFAFIIGFLPTSRRRSTPTHLDNNVFVQNIEEIRHVLELAKTEFDIIESSSSQQSQLLHSVRIEETIGYFEQIAHPGDKSVKVSVPKFYASVVNNIGGQEMMFRQLTLGKLLTPELAGMIGGDATKAGTDPNTDAASSSSDRTIFVSIISKSDSRCSDTVTNLLRSAANPERIHVAVVDRTNPLSKRYVACDAPPIPCSSDPDQILCMYNANVDVYELDSKLDAGAMFARHIGQRMYRGEYYALQVGVDAGIVFSDGWDEDLIRQLEATNNEMAVITTYLSETKIRDGNRPINATPERYTICHASYEGDGRERRLEHTRSDQVEQAAPPDRTQTPMLQPFWSSELSFSRGHFVLQVPYDPQLCGLDEQDEEVSMALRAFSSGYDFYTPTQSVILRTKIDSNRYSDGVGLCNANAKKKSRKRLYSLIGLDNIDEDAIPHEYGLGAVRDTAKFFTLYGIHASERVTEHRLCEFVTTGNMHDEFVPYTRHDGMGIDYIRISFRFHELISIHKDSHQ